MAWRSLRRGYGNLVTFLKGWLPCMEVLEVGNLGSTQCTIPGMEQILKKCFLNKRNSLKWRQQLFIHYRKILFSLGTFLSSHGVSTPSWKGKFTYLLEGRSVGHETHRVILSASWNELMSLLWESPVLLWLVTTADICVVFMSFRSTCHHTSVTEAGRAGWASWEVQSVTYPTPRSPRQQGTGWWTPNSVSFLLASFGQQCHSHHGTMGWASFLFKSI